MLYTYDPKLLVVTFGGIPITGYADGTFLTIERNTDLWNTVVGASGETSRAKSNDRSAVATIILKQTSPSNDVFTSFHKADELANAGVREFLAKDALGTTLVFSGFAYVIKMASAEFGKEITNREWRLFCVDMDIFVGGNFPNP